MTACASTVCASEFLRIVLCGGGAYAPSTDAYLVRSALGWQACVVRASHTPLVHRNIVQVTFDDRVEYAATSSLVFAKPTRTMCANGGLLCRVHATRDESVVGRTACALTSANASRDHLALASGNFHSTVTPSEFAAAVCRHSDPGRDRAPIWCLTVADARLTAPRLVEIVDLLLKSMCDLSMVEAHADVHGAARCLAISHAAVSDGLKSLVASWSKPGSQSDPRLGPRSDPQSDPEPRPPDLARLFERAPAPVAYRPATGLEAPVISFAGGECALALVDAETAIAIARDCDQREVQLDDSLLDFDMDGHERVIREMLLTRACSRAGLDRPVAPATDHALGPRVRVLVAQDARVSAVHGSPRVRWEVSQVTGVVRALFSGVPVAQVATAAHAWDSVLRSPSPDSRDASWLGNALDAGSLDRIASLRSERYAAARTIARSVERNLDAVRRHVWRPEGRLVRNLARQNLALATIEASDSDSDPDSDPDSDFAGRSTAGRSTAG